jgi:hypothetical protein
MIIYKWAGDAKAEFKTALARRHHRADDDHVPPQRRGRRSSGIATGSGDERAVSSAR